MTNETNQTSVDKLFDQLSTENLLGLFTWDQMQRAMEILEQAKAMHKKEIKEAIIFGDCRGEMRTFVTFERYYNETYAGETKQI